MLKDFLFFSFILIYIVLQLRLIRVDALFSFSFFYLFIYTIFALTGYFYFPYTSGLIDAYFGDQIDLNVILFVIFSFIFTFLLLNLAGKLLEEKQPLFSVSNSSFNHPALALPLVASLTAFQCWGLIHFGDDISYSNSSDPDFISNSSATYTIWFTLFKETPTILIVLYSVIRYRIWEREIPRLIAQFLLALSLLIFFIASKQLGNRIDSISLLNGFVMVELIYRSGQKSNFTSLFVRLGAVAIPMFAFMMWTKMARSEYSDLQMSRSELLLMQDYFSPAHLMFTAIAKNLIDPLEVIRSNFYNSLILMNYPLLHIAVTDTINPGLASRSQGYAFHIFTEGYMFMGLWGFIYNGIIISSGLYFWRRLTSTNSGNMSALLLPIIAIDVANVARVQSSYFIKDLYFHFIPALFFIFICTGNYIRGVIISHEKANR